MSQSVTSLSCLVVCCVIILTRYCNSPAGEPKLSFKQFTSQSHRMSRITGLCVMLVFISNLSQKVTPSDKSNQICSLNFARSILMIVKTCRSEAARTSGSENAKLNEHVLNM